MNKEIISKNRKKNIRKRKKGKHKKTCNEKQNINNIINTNNSNKNNNKNIIIPNTPGTERVTDILNSTIKQKQIKNVEKIMEFNDDQINLLLYELAIKNDKRTYCRYYISLLKTKHNLINSFCYSKDYNSKIIKIDLFFVGFAIYYTVNALFFDDDTMHRIYVSKGSFDLEYQLPKIIYSSLISTVLNMPLKLLALSNNAIIKFKQDKNINNVDKRGEELKKKLKIKFILYFIISFIFLLFFWYYISMFGAIYRNTQLHLLKDTLISFGLSLLYPFGIYLLPGLFRIPSLSNPKNKKECLYNFSKLLQFF